MANIYDLHDKAFNRVSAYVIAKNGERVATLAFKFPADGAGRLWCYLHVLGDPMVRAYAGGYGYDKRSAAARNAADLLSDSPAALPIKTAIRAGESRDWNDYLRDAGYLVMQAV